MVTVPDGLILHALQINPKASFRLIASTTGLSEQAVARRYRQMHRDGVVRVVGRLNPALSGDAQWVARIQVKPDRMSDIADALARRPDVAYASVQSGGCELLCIIAAPHVESRRTPLLQQLPRNQSILTTSVDLVLNVFGDLDTTVWTPFREKLSPTQIAHLTENAIIPEGDPPIEAIHGDENLLNELSRNGRTPHAELAKATGWSVARVNRRLRALEASRTLIYDTDLLPERIGYQTNAVLWLTTAPEHTAAVGTELAAHDEVAFVAALTGTSNIMAVAICRDTQDLYRYVTEALAATKRIQSYAISIRDRSLKQSVSLVTRGRLVPPHH